MKCQNRQFMKFTTLAKKVVTAEKFIRLIRQSDHVKSCDIKLRFDIDATRGSASSHCRLKSMSHDITWLHCGSISWLTWIERFSKPNIRFGSGRAGSKIVSKFRLTHNRKLRSANRNTIDHTIACPALLLWCLAVENRGPCVPKKCSLSNCASPGDSCQVLDHWWSHGQQILPIHSLMMTMYLPKISCRS